MAGNQRDGGHSSLWICSLRENSCCMQPCCCSPVLQELDQEIDFHAWSLRVEGMQPPCLGLKLHPQGNMNVIVRPVKSDELRIVASWAETEGWTLTLQVCTLLQPRQREKKKQAYTHISLMIRICSPSACSVHLCCLQDCEIFPALQPDGFLAAEVDGEIAGDSATCLSRILVLGSAVFVKSSTKHFCTKISPQVHFCLVETHFETLREYCTT